MTDNLFFNLACHINGKLIGVNHRFSSCIYMIDQLPTIFCCKSDMVEFIHSMTVQILTKDIT